MPLENYYAGKETWNNFVELCEENWMKCSFQGELLKELHSAEDIAKVIYFRMGSSTMNFIDNKIPALENLTPKECMETQSLRTRLKECLLRMH